MTSRALKAWCGLLLFALAGCQTSKSSSPTAPTVAGPIAGVTITAPALVEPAQGFKFKESEQPIKLVVQNATTSGVRALTYSFEVAADSGFGTKVFSRSGVAPGDGRTSVTIDRLEIGRTYYWRAWAEDGANTGARATAGFEIYPKASINAPVAVSPVNNAAVNSTTPTLVTANAATVGPVGFLAYEFQVATDQAFSRLVAAGVVNEGSGQTSFNSSPLANAATMYWRVRAADSESASGWSATQAFRTPSAPVPSPTPTPTPGGGGGTGSCASKDGPTIINCITAKYPDKLVAGISLSQRQANMSFIRDRVIEAGRCAGLDLAWNLKRGGPDISIDFITEKVNGAVRGHDIAFDYDNTSTPLHLVWGDGDFPFYGAYTNSFTCGG
jgi:hypothetical protein